MKRSWFCLACCGSVFLACGTASVPHTGAGAPGAGASASSGAPVRSAIGSTESPAASASASATAAPSGSASAAPEANVTIVRFEVSGSAPRRAAEPLRAALAGAGRCVSMAGVVFHDVDLEIDAKGEIVDTRLSSRDPKAPSCLRELVDPVRLPPDAQRRTRKVTLVLRSGPVSAPLGVKLRQDEQLLVDDENGRCLGRTEHPCAPHKMCMAPTDREVDCPVEYGLAGE